MSDGKIALVTGAGSGIGKAVALALMKDGYSVVLAGRRREPLEAVAREGGSGHAVPADVTDAVSVAALFSAVEQRFGRLDLLFNNAGVNAPAIPVEDLPIAKWHEVMAANVTGVFLCTRAAFALMKSQKPRGGRIINNGSIGAHTPRPNTAPYTASKHAVLGLTKSTALDGRKYDIACGQIDIGNADTGWADKFKKGVVQANGEIAPEPVLDLEHVAKAVLTMASLPLDANILTLTVMATKMPFVGRG
jgi:NAD(P)-dependent dehydrogenase (short-subunit alcohol dehydrogenase family)